MNNCQSDFSLVLSKNGNFYEKQETDTRRRNSERIESSVGLVDSNSMLSLVLSKNGNFYEKQETDTRRRNSERIESSVGLVDSNLMLSKVCRFTSLPHKNRRKKLHPSSTTFQGFLSTRKEHAQA